MSGVELVVEVTKHLITLSSAFLALSVSFSKDLVGKATLRIKFAWLFWILTIGASLWALLALTAQVQVGGNDIWLKQIRIPMVVATLSFFAGCCSFAWQALSAVK